MAFNPQPANTASARPGGSAPAVPPPPPPPPSKLTETGTKVAVLVVCAWLVMLFVVLVAAHSATDPIWVRVFSVLSSLESVAFAAAGALFGTTIQQRRVQDAKDAAQQAKSDSKDAQKEAAGHAEAATKGRALAEALKATGSPAQSRDDLLHERFEPGADRPHAAAASSAELSRLRELASRLFP